jgi:hypothetical protein
MVVAKSSTAKLLLSMLVGGAVTTAGGPDLPHSLAFTPPMALVGSRSGDQRGAAYAAEGCSTSAGVDVAPRSNLLAAPVGERGQGTD